MMASTVAGRTDVDFSRVADSLLNANQAQVRSLLSPTIGTWARADPDAALGWARANADRLAPDAFSRIAQGKLERFYKDNVLVDQPFVKDASMTVQEMLKKNGFDVVRYVRYALGG